MGRSRKHKKNNGRKTSKPNLIYVREKENSNTNNPNERKLEITDDSGTTSQVDSEEQSYGLQETEGKKRNDYDMEPNVQKEESLQSMDTLGENNGNGKDKHGGKTPSETTRPQNTDTQETVLSEMKPPGGDEASSVTPQCRLHICEVHNDSTSTGADNNKDETVSPQSSDNGADRGTDETPSSNASLNRRNSKTSHEQKIEELEDDITQLKENLDAQQKEIKRQDEIMNKKSGENAELLQRCLTLEKSAEAAENLKREQNKTHYDEIQALKDELYSAKEEYENLKQQQIQETENTTAELQRLMDENRYLTDELSSAKEENENLKQQLIQETENTTAELERLMDENKYLTESLEQERQTSAALKEEAQSFQREIINLKNDEEDLNNQVEKLNAQLRTIDSENRAWKVQHSSCEEIIIKLEEKLQETEERKRSELEDNVNHYRAEMTKQEELARDLLKKLACAEEEVKRLYILLQETDQSRRFSEEDTSTESNDIVREDVAREKTVVASDAKSEDDSVQNENIEHDNMNSEDMQRSTSPTTNDSMDPSITFESRQRSGAFDDDVGDVGLRNGEMSLNQNEAENNNVVEADNFEVEMDSPQSPDFGTDMAQHQGSDETQNYNSLSDLQNKTSHEEEIEKLQRELNILKENLINKQEEIKRRDESINEKNAENADLLHRCVTLETSAEAADNVREQFEDLNQQIEALEGDLASARDENENLKRHLEEIENVTADHQRLIDDNKSLKESSEQERRATAALKEEVQTLKEQITNHEDVVNVLKRQLKEANGEKEKLEAKLVSRNGENSDTLAQFLKNEKRGEELTAELKKMQQNDQDKARRIEELSGQLNLKNEELTATEIKHKHEMEEIKAKYKTDKDEAERNKEVLKNQMTKLGESFQHLQAENKQIKDDLQTKSMECGNFKSERLRITKDLDAARKEISELNYVKDKLTADITAANAELMQLKTALELKEAKEKFANECLQKAVREQQEMMYSIGHLQRIELENEQVKNQYRYLLEQNTKLHASLQEYGLLRDHIQEYYRALQDSQMELQREKEKSRHINELLSRTGYRLDSMASELHNYRKMAESYRSSLEEEKEKFNKLERELDRLTVVNENLTEERDKCEQKSFEYRDKCKSLREDLEKSQAECRELLSQTQEGASDGKTGLLQGFQNPSSQTCFVFGKGKDKMNRKK